MESLRISLPAPSGATLRRQTCLGMDGLPISPIPLYRSISDMSHGSDTSEEKTRKQVVAFIKTLQKERAMIEEDISELKLSLASLVPARRIHIEERIGAKEMKLSHLQKKIKRAEIFLEVLSPV